MFWSKCRIFHPICRFCIFSSFVSTFCWAGTYKRFCSTFGTVSVCHSLRLDRFLGYHRGQACTRHISRKVHKLTPLQLLSVRYTHSCKFYHSKVVPQDTQFSFLCIFYHTCTYHYSSLVLTDNLTSFQGTFPSSHNYRHSHSTTYLAPCTSSLLRVFRTCRSKSFGRRRDTACRSTRFTGSVGIWEFCDRAFGTCSLRSSRFRFFCSLGP